MFLSPNMNTRIANSIFEYLTSKNPEVKYTKTSSKSVHNDITWQWPQELQPWDEFNFETMENVFQGELMRECRLERELYYPLPSTPWDNNEAGEDTSIEILTTWTNTILKQALNAVISTLNPVGRVPGSLCNRKVIGKARTPFHPDGGSVTPSELGNPRGATPHILSDVKPALNWESSVFIKNSLEPDGRVIRQKILKQYGAPIRQIYTYCVEYKVRYGFLLTSKEVFLVRVRPQPGRGSESQTQTELKQTMKDHGLMEYKSIPWSEYRNEESMDEYRQLTMNLSLWCIHVLAGSNHELRWTYEPLEVEEKSEVENALEISNALTQSFATITEAETVRHFLCLC